MSERKIKIGHLFSVNRGRCSSVPLTVLEIGLKWCGLYIFYKVDFSGLKVRYKVGCKMRIFSECTLIFLQGSCWVYKNLFCDLYY